MNDNKKITSLLSQRRIKLFSLFLLLSLSFLVLTKLTRDYTNTVSFELNFNNLPQEQVIVKDSTHKLDITLKTYGFKLFRYLLTKPKVDVDVTTLSKTGNNYYWLNNKQYSLISNQFDDNVEIIAINPDTLVLPFDENYVKKVPVALKKTINFDLGYNISGKVKLVPDSIKVIGPKTIVDTVKTITTKDFILKNVKKDFNKKVKLEFPINDEQVSYSHNEIEVVGNVEKFTEGEYNIPITVTNLPNNISLSYFPKTIKVIFYTSLKQYNSIKSKDFKVECDYKKVDTINHTLIAELKNYPDFLQSVRLGSNRVEYIIKK